MDAKLQILKDTFQSRYDSESFKRFVTEFFGTLKFINPDTDNTAIPYEYKYTVNSYRHIASYTTGSDTLDVFSVKLQSGRGKAIERARSMQRSFISKLLTNMGHDGAIVAFYTDNDPRWRLSFVRLDYELAEGRVKMNLTPARRYSYLVGESEPCHTAMEQLFPIFRVEDYRPTLDRIEEAFSVERVTKDFFEKYKEKYFVLKEYLDSTDEFNEEATRCGFTSEQFAKKLMGQLSFLYFLQKKGWLGISVFSHELTEKEYKNVFYKSSSASRELIPKIYKSVAADSYKLDVKTLQSLSDSDADKAAGWFKADEWGKGEKKFVRHLFTNCKTRNFFDDYLEPLFYEALNQKRGNNYFYKRFNCKIPFLNGGLFEPLEGYDWQYSKFAIPNEIFSNSDETDEREADGILDIFDRYNFTMNEDEPLEREVAVDPEMLGKIFENLLDAKDRKSKGAFYTPREIVHYMCAESLINYLVGKTGVPYDDMKTFIIDGEFLKDEDYWSDKERKLPKSVFDKLDEIDKALETIKVADLAVGSGAFPLGMLSEIVKARITISYYKAGQIRYPYEQLQKQRSERRKLFERYDPYRLKWNTIQNCIFAVDIEASAVDIAKLRLWLSLVVEEDLTPSEEEQQMGEQRDPHPLPNLDYNIMCGNSLIDEFEGVQLFDDALLGIEMNNTPGRPKDIMQSLFMDNLDDLRSEQERLFGEQTPSVKRDIKSNIDKIIDNIIRGKLEGDNNQDGLRKYEENLKQKTKPYFLWKLEFAHIFRENGGFDIVIGNPPYVQLQDNGGELANKYRDCGYESFTGRSDIYCLFYERGHQLLKKDGHLCYITSNKWMRSAYGKDLRGFFAKHIMPVLLIDFPGQQVFDSVTVESNILLFRKSTNDGNKTLVCKATGDWRLNLSDFVRQNATPTTFAASDSWAILNPIEQSIKEKIEKVGTPLKDWDISINYGIKTGFNEAFIINESKRMEILKNCVTGEERKRTDELIRPILRGRDIKRYGYDWARLYIIVAHNGIPEKKISRIKIEDYPAVKKHLDLYFARLSVRADKGDTPYNLRSCAYMEDFCKQKIVWGEISDKSKFALDTKGVLVEATSFMMTGGNLKFILANVNSKLGEWMFNQIGTTTGLGTNRWKKYTLQMLPIKIPTESECLLVEQFIDRIIETNSFDEISKLDKIIYRLYELSQEEIEFIERQ